MLGGDFPWGWAAIRPTVASIGGTLFDVERVEVLKGPQGTLFGEGSQGGTVRYIYNAPNPSKVDYRINAGYSTLDHSGDDGYRIDGMVNVPLADNFAVRPLAFSSEDGGFIDKTNLTPLDEDVNGRESTGGRLSAKKRRLFAELEDGEVDAMQASIGDALAAATPGP